MKPTRHHRYLWSVLLLLLLAAASPALAQQDTDGDGLGDLDENLLGTHPYNNDTDADGMPDGWEVFHLLNPLVNDAAEDPDNDGILNIDEFLAPTWATSTDPSNNNSDHDDMNDGEERNSSGRDPSVYDGTSPDLWLQDLVVVDPAVGEITDLTVVAILAGNLDTSVNLEVRIDGGLIDSHALQVSQSEGMTIHSITTQFTPTANSHDIALSLDPLDLISEFVETNNEASTTLSLLPDLTVVVEEPVFQSDNGITAEFEVPVTVTNLGPAPAVSSVRLGQTTQAISLQPFEAAQVLFSETLTIGQNHSLDSDVDPTALLTEIQETNNMDSRILDVSAALSFGQIIFTPGVDQLEARIDILNDGTVPASGVLDLVASETYASSESFQIAPSSSDLILFDFSLPGGDHDLELVLEAQPGESTADNYHSTSVVIPGQWNLSGSISPPAEILEGGPLTVPATIHSIGTEASPDLALELTLGGRILDRQDISGLTIGETMAVDFQVSSVPLSGLQMMALQIRQTSELLDSQPVEILSLPSLEIDLAHADRLKAGANTEVELTLVNSGDQSVSGWLDLRISGIPGSIAEPFFVDARGETSVPITVLLPDGLVTRLTVTLDNMTPLLEEVIHTVQLSLEPTQTSTTGIPLALVLGIGSLLALGIAASATKESTKWRWFLALAPLYSKIHRAKVLDHDMRGKVYEYVTEHPGVHLAQVTVALQVANGTAVHHLSTLEREEYLVSRREGNRRCFYPHGQQRPRVEERLSDVQTRILRMIQREPGISNSQIAAAAGDSRQKINYHIKLLTSKGRIMAVRQGRKNGLYPVVRVEEE